MRKVIIYQYNDELSDYQELELEEDIPLHKLLDSSLIFLYVDFNRSRIWIWQGANTTTRIKFISAKRALNIRDRYDTAFRITAVNEGNEPVGFKVMIGLEDEQYNSTEETNLVYGETEEDLALLEQLRNEKMVLLKNRVLQDLAEKGLRKILAIMERESIEEIAIERQYLQEMFDGGLIKLNKDDGLPILEGFLIEFMRRKGVRTELYGNVVKFFRSEPEEIEILDKFELENIESFKRLYADGLLREANMHFNKEAYESAAKLYERVGQWVSLAGLSDKILIEEAYTLAMSSWLSAYKVDNAFRILENIPHEKALRKLKRISKKINLMAESLLKSKNFKLAREQIHAIIINYHMKGLFTEVQGLHPMLAEVLIEIFKEQVRDKKLFIAKYTYEEIENVWDSYNVKRVNLDSSLKILIRSLIIEKIFQDAKKLITKLRSSKLKRNLTNFCAKAEEKYQAEKAEEVKKFFEE